jgi:hypothetical protein
MIAKDILTNIQCRKQQFILLLSAKTKQAAVFSFIDVRTGQPIRLVGK